jgi:hypothetical protein
VLILLNRHPPWPVLHGFYAGIFLQFSCFLFNSLDGPVTDMREACKKGYFMTGRNYLLPGELPKHQ